MTDFLQTLDERSDGIGAQDADIIFGTEAGALYTEARMAQATDRRVAFDMLHDFGTPRGTALDFHPVGPTFAVERERGIPAAWHK
jgi:hypothetical protein